MTPYLCGTVGTTGIWRIGRNVDAIHLLSVAGVPGLGTSERDVRRRFVLHIYRDDGGERREVYAEEVENLIGGSAAPVPTLHNEDNWTIEMRGRRRISLDLVFTTVSMGSSFLSLYLLLRREF
jgi:hypothetical protein